MEIQSVTLIVKVLNDAGVRYLVVGELAVNAHGFQRFTNDLDLVVALAPANIITALNSLSEIGYHPMIPVTPDQFASAENRETWNREKGMLVLRLWSDVHRRTPIDIFIREPFDFDEEYSQALSFSVAENLDMPVLPYESLLKMKLEAGREKDLQDISALRKLEPHRK